MDITNLVNHIRASCPSIAQVVKAEDVSRQPIDTSVIIYDIVKGAVDGRAYPSKLPGVKNFPALVYQLVSSNKVS